MESVITLINKIPLNTLDDILGIRSRSSAEKVLDSGELNWISKKQIENTLEVVYKPTLKSDPVTVHLRWTNKLLLDKCSCGKVWRSGQKFCSHSAIVILGITQDDLFFETESEPEDEIKQIFIKERTAIKHIEIQDNKTSLQALKLDIDLLRKTLSEIQEFVEALVKTGLHRVSQATLEWTNALVIKARIAKLINL
ncbi:MAG: hypothetical protein ACXAC7_22085, partial [Candidatus Hodarchaeales archaeon]